MGMFNLLKTNMYCPMCNKTHDLEAEFRFGYLNLLEYSIGDKMAWESGAHPVDGRFIGEGYVECEESHRDFWVDIVIENNTIDKVVVRHDREGYIKKDKN